MNYYVKPVIFWIGDCMLKVKKYKLINKKINNKQKKAEAYWHKNMSCALSFLFGMQKFFA